MVQLRASSAWRMRLAALLFAAAAIVTVRAAEEEEDNDGEDSEVCDASGECITQEWKAMEYFIQDTPSTLNCSEGGEPRSVVAYCAATRPEKNDCDFEAPAPDGKADSPEYQEWRRGCLFRCLFDQPDLNVVDISGDDAVALLSPLSQEGYKATPFLDTRSFPHGNKACQYVAPMLQLQELANWGKEHGKKVAGMKVGTRVHFIFHLGHVASTLLTRMLDQLSNVLVLREPPILSWAASAFVNASGKKIKSILESPVMPFLSRRHDDDQMVVVKAKSTAIRFMKAAMRFHKNTKIVFLYADLTTYLTVILARKEDRFPDDQYEALPNLDSRVFKEYALKTKDFQDLSVVKRIALGWLKRMKLVLSFGEGSMLPLDMADFVADPGTLMSSVAYWFGRKLPIKEAEEIANDDRVTGVYAKDQSLKWGSVLQQRLMAGRAEIFQKEIAEGVEFAKQMISRDVSLQHLGRLLQPSQEKK